jgi:hypothetical protein
MVVNLEGDEFIGLGWLGGNRRHHEEKQDT